MTQLAQPIQEGKALLEKLQFQEAETHFNNLLSDETHRIDALVWLGRMDLMRERTEAGLKRLDEALEQEPGHAEAMALKGLQKLKEEQLIEALFLLEQARKADETLHMVYVNLSICYRKLDRLKDAREAIDKAVEMDAEDYQARYELSYVMALQEDIEGAIHELLKTLELNPLHLASYITLGTLYKEAGEFDLVIELYEEALRHNPNAHILREEVGELCMIRQKQDQALTHAKELTARRDFFGDHLRVGRFCLAAGQFEEAEAAFKKANELNPQNWQGHYNLAELYFAGELLDLAEAEYRKAIELGPEEFQAYNGLGQLLMHKDDAEAAHPILLKALECAPDQVAPIFNMALCCTMRKDYDGGTKFAETARLLSPPSSHIHDEATRLLQTIQEERNKA